MLLPLGKVKVELNLKIVFIIEGQDISKRTALPLKGQLISPGKIKMFAQNVIRGYIGLMTVTLRLTVKEISSPCQKMGGEACPRPKTQVYVAMSRPAAPIRYIPQRNASLSATLFEAPQEVQD